MTNHPDPPPTTQLENVFECALREFEDDLDQAASRASAPLSEILRRAGLTDLLPALTTPARTSVPGVPGGHDKIVATSAAAVSPEDRDEAVEYAADSTSIGGAFVAPGLGDTDHPGWGSGSWDSDPWSADHIGHEETLFAVECRDLAGPAQLPPGHAAISAFSGQWIARWVRHHDTVGNDEDLAPGRCMGSGEAQQTTAGGHLEVDPAAGRLGRARVEQRRRGATWTAYGTERVDQDVAVALGSEAAWIPAMGAHGGATSRGYERLWNMCARALDVVVVIVGDPLAAGAAEVMTRWANPRREAYEVHQAPGAAALRFRSDDQQPGENDPPPKGEFASFVEAIMRMSNYATGGTLIVLEALADRAASCITKTGEAPGHGSRGLAGTRSFPPGPAAMVKVMLCGTENATVHDVCGERGVVVPLRAIADRRHDGSDAKGQR